MKNFLRCCVVALFVLTCLNAPAATPEQKANFIISIVRNIEWPADMRNQSVFRVAVYGSYPLYRELIDELMGKSVYNKNIEVLNLARPQDFDLADSHVIYIAREASNKATFDWITKQTHGRGSLLMGEKESALQDGAGINFTTRNNQLQFEVSENNARLQGVKITTNLMNFAANKN